MVRKRIRVETGLWKSGKRRAMLKIDIDRLYQQILVMVTKRNTEEVKEDFLKAAGTR